MLLQVPKVIFDLLFLRRVYGNPPYFHKYLHFYGVSAASRPSLLSSCLVEPVDIDLHV